uniref:Alpha-galactosidase n=1 Tax=Acrobeloides nanus TaxID=290746 RepID=A0A914EHL4_9BILA
MFLSMVNSEDNGLARLPPMGWMSWLKYYCYVDCIDYPNGCINQDLYMAQADRLASDGWLALGYSSIHIDDCWQQMNRSADGKLVPDRTRFSNGIDALAKYMHDRNLTLGIYSDVGNKTCMGYPGSFGYEDVDAQTFAGWGIDYLKYDGCATNASASQQGLTKMHAALKNTGRSILLSLFEFEFEDLAFVKSISNLQRVYDDVQRYWASILEIIDAIVARQDWFSLYTGPGFWIDPDQNGTIMTFVKKMMPCFGDNCSYAIALLNRDNTTAQAKSTSFVLSDLNLTNPHGYNIMDLWAGKVVGTYKPSDTYSAMVNATGVHFIKAITLQ